MSERLFPTAAELDASLCAEVILRLQEGLAQRGAATLVVSGGSTPTGLFKRLADVAIDWQNVTVLLADDRWAATTHADSNEAMVERTLLQGHAAAANFLSLVPSYPDLESNLHTVEAKLAALPRFDVVLLGMGLDSHTASLFPCSPEIQSAMSTAAAALVTQPTTAPHKRVTLSRRRLENTAWGAVHITGSKKVAVVAKATTEANPYSAPVGAFLPPRGHFELWCTDA